MLLSDSHIHTMFSYDSEENPVNVVNNAISLGFKHICFTDHNDFDAPLEDGKVMFDLDFPEYIKYFQNLKESYNDKINIHIGVEQGLMRSVADRVNSYDSAKQLDFIIGSSHLVYGEDPYYPEFWEKRSAKDTVLTYYESILDNLSCCFISLPTFIWIYSNLVNSLPGSIIKIKIPITITVTGIYILAMYYITCSKQ